MTITDIADANGGVLTTAHLLGSGETDDSIRQAVSDGHLVRLRRGWYRLTASDADEQVVETVRGGAVVSCATALRRHGLWVPKGYDDAHARITRHQRRHEPDRCRRNGRPTPARSAVDDVPTALQYAVRCMSEEDFVIVCDSALHQGHITEAGLLEAFADAPRRIREAIAKTDRRAASGTETAARLRLRAVGLPVEVQHEVPGVGWVDLLVGRRLIIELDSVEHHTGATNYESDRARDRKLLALGYLILRLTYSQVFDRWPSTYADITEMIAKRYHRRQVC